MQLVACANSGKLELLRHEWSISLTIFERDHSCSRRSEGKGIDVGKMKMTQAAKIKACVP